MKWIYLLLIAGLGMLCGSCSKQIPNEAKLAAPIQFGVAQAPLNLDPRFATDAASERVNRLLYQPLVDFDANANPIPVLARWQQLSPVVYRFQLIRDDIHFHHGAFLTASDVAATYASFNTLKNSPHTAEFNNIRAIEVLNRQSVDFYLKTPDRHFVSKLTIGILPQDLLAQNHDFSHQPIGSGPLQFVSWHQSLQLKRIIDGQLISLLEVKDPMVRVLKLLHGELDLLQADLSPELVKYLQGKAEVTVKTSIGQNFSYLGINTQDTVLQQHKVRLALAYSIDREAIMRHVMLGGTRLANVILPPEHYTNTASIGLPPYGYQPALARQLLREAGVTLPLHLVYKTSTDAQRVRFATIMQAQMAAAGIHLEIRSLDWATYLQDIKQGNFQLYGLTWVGIKTPDIYTKAFASQSVPPNGLNRGRYSDAVLDHLLMSENWAAITQRIHQQLPYIPLWYEGQFAAMRANIRHYAPKADGNWDDLSKIERNTTISNKIGFSLKDTQ